MTVTIRLAQKIRSIIGSPDISGVLGSVEQLLEESVGAEPFFIDRDAVQRVDLTQIDFDAHSGMFTAGKKYTAAQQLRASLQLQIDRMARLNPTPINYAAKLQAVIDRYNAGSLNIDTLFEELKELAQSLTEEALALFDLLTKPEPELTATQEA